MSINLRATETRTVLAGGGRTRVVLFFWSNKNVTHFWYLVATHWGWYFNSFGQKQEQCFQEVGALELFSGCTRKLVQAETAGDAAGNSNG